MRHVDCELLYPVCFRSPFPRPGRHPRTVTDGADADIYRSSSSSIRAVTSRAKRPTRSLRGRLVRDRSTRCPGPGRGTCPPTRRPDHPCGPGGIGRVRSTDRVGTACITSVRTWYGSADDAYPAFDLPTERSVPKRWEPGGSAGFWLAGSMPPCRLRRRNF